jgi:hypothetical protein
VTVAPGLPHSKAACTRAACAFRLWMYGEDVAHRQEGLSEEDTAVSREVTAMDVDVLPHVI